MLLLTLLAVEGMARLAYYLAFDQGYGGAADQDAGGGLAALAADVPAAEPAAAFNRARVRHPFYAYTHPDPWAGLNEMPPRPESDDTVVIALVGGSVAEQVQTYLQRAVYRYFIANELPRRPTVLALADGAMKQPSQLAVAANTLLLGGHFDLLVNLDGFNEIYFSFANRQKGVFPFYPEAWRQRRGFDRHGDFADWPHCPAASRTGGIAAPPRGQPFPLHRPLWLGKPLPSRAIGTADYSGQSRIGGRRIHLQPGKTRPPAALLRMTPSSCKRRPGSGIAAPCCWPPWRNWPGPTITTFSSPISMSRMPSR